MGIIYRQGWCTMIIKDAVMATEVARKVIGNPRVFEPISAAKTDDKWVVEANIGVVDRIVVRVELPERVISM